MIGPAGTDGQPRAQRDDPIVTLPALPAVDLGVGLGPVAGRSEWRRKQSCETAAPTGQLLLAIGAWAHGGSHLGTRATLTGHLASERPAS